MLQVQGRPPSRQLRLAVGAPAMWPAVFDADSDEGEEATRERVLRELNLEQINLESGRWNAKGFLSVSDLNLESVD